MTTDDEIKIIGHISAFLLTYDLMKRHNVDNLTNEELIAKLGQTVIQGIKDASIQ